MELNRVAASTQTPWDVPGWVVAAGAAPTTTVREFLAAKAALPPR